MSRQFRAIFLLLTIFWQSLSMLSPLTVADRAAQFDHTTLHWQTIDHHHHGDQSSHMEDTGGVSKHFHVDSEFNSIGLLSAAPPEMASVLPDSLPMTFQTQIPKIYPEGPLRPPRLQLA